MEAVMIRTNKLRFIERDIYVPNLQGFGVVAKTVRVLQQWYAETVHEEILVIGFSFKTESVNGEWRDVPLEKENE
jgi:UDP-N-acetyl-D-mannosaminuronate dehydrogenase